MPHLRHPCCFIPSPENEPKANRGDEQTARFHKTPKAAPAAGESHDAFGYRFGGGDWGVELGATTGPISLAFRPVINNFNGRRTVELHVADWRCDEATPATAATMPTALAVASIHRDLDLQFIFVTLGNFYHTLTGRQSKLFKCGNEI